MLEGEVFIAPAGTPPSSDDWQPIGFADVSEWVGRELASTTYDAILSALDHSLVEGCRLRRVAISREQYEVLEDDLLRRAVETPFTWAPGPMGRTTVFGADLVIVPPDIPPPPGCADARPQQRFRVGEAVQPREELYVSEAVVGDSVFLRRIVERHLEQHFLPLTWPCGYQVEHYAGPMYRVTITPAAWIVGVDVGDSPVAVSVAVDDGSVRTRAVPERGQREGEGWSDYIDRIANTSRMDDVLASWSDSMSVTFDGTEGEYPF